jgi:hypothetical protein
MAGWGDGLERCMCLAVIACPPRSFPVQHRTSVATVEPIVIDRSDTRILFCDGLHEGPHIWPDGEVVA